MCFTIIYRYLLVLFGGNINKGGGPALFMFMDRFHKKRSSGIGSWFVIGLGTLVTLLGFSMRNKNEKLHAGITG